MVSFGQILVISTLFSTAHGDLMRRERKMRVGKTTPDFKAATPHTDFTNSGKIDNTLQATSSELPALASAGSSRTDLLVTEGMYKGMGQCPATLIDKMERECQKNVSMGAACHREQFIHANSKNWLRKRLHETRFPRIPPKYWQINKSYNLDGANVSMLSDLGLYHVKRFLTPAEADELRATFEREIDNTVSLSVGCPILRHHCQDPAFLTYPEDHCELRHAHSQRFPSHSQGVPKILKKIELLTKTSRNQSHRYEGFQMSKYLPGDFFSAHYDDDSCQDQLAEIPEKCSLATRRMITVLTYLTGTSDAVGGATYFHDLDVKFHADKGDAIVFFPVYLDGTLNPWLMHGSQDSYTTKYVAQQWITMGELHEISNEAV